MSSLAHAAVYTPGWAAHPRLQSSEVARVLRPGGQLHFVEHGCSPDAKVQRWQRWLDKPWSRFAVGCHIDRDIPKVLEQGGLQVDSLETYYTESEPHVLGCTFEGRATRQP